jgi:hypothetical protein
MRNPPAQAVVNADGESVRVLADSNTTPPRVIVAVSKRIPQPGGLASLERVSYQDVRDVRIIALTGESLAYTMYTTPSGQPLGTSGGGGASFNLDYRLVNPADFQNLGRVTFKYRDREYSFDVSRVFPAEISEATRIMRERRGLPPLTP